MTESDIAEVEANIRAELDKLAASDALVVMAELLSLYLACHDTVPGTEGFDRAVSSLARRTADLWQTVVASDRGEEAPKPIVAIDPADEPDQTMNSLIEIQAIMLAAKGIVPQTPEFEAVVTKIVARLAERTYELRKTMVKAAN